MGKKQKPESRIFTKKKKHFTIPALYIFETIINY